MMVTELQCVSVCVMLAMALITVESQICSFTRPPCAPPITGGSRNARLNSAEIQGTTLVHSWRIKSTWDTQTITHGGAAIPSLCDWDFNQDCSAFRAWDSIGTQGACLDTLEYRYDLAQTAVDCDYTVTDNGDELEYNKVLTWQADGTRPNGNSLTRSRARTVNVVFPKGIPVTTTSPAFGGNNVAATLDILNIDAVNDATPTFELSLTITTENPWRILNVLVPVVPSDVIAVTPFVFTDVSCNLAGQPCTQTVARTGQFTTPCPTRDSFQADAFQFQLQFECQPQETCTGANNGILGDVFLDFTVTSENYCAEVSVQTIDVLPRAYASVNILDSAAYPQTQGAETLLYKYGERINWELQAVSDFSLAFRDA